MDIELWKEGVMENSHDINILIKDRYALKKAFEDYIRKFFDFEEIHFDTNLDKITIRWKWHNKVVFDPIVFKEFKLDWCITIGHSDMLGQCLEVEIYPFGFIKEDED